MHFLFKKKVSPHIEPKKKTKERERKKKSVLEKRGSVQHSQTAPPLLYVTVKHKRITIKLMKNGTV